MKAQKIKELLGQNGYTLSSLAREWKTSRQNLHSIVHGRTKTRKWRVLVAHYAGCTVHELWPDN
jgi:lambda repressor-like predicted transcriptional regulator